MFSINGTVKEWFEYKGNPYCFKVELDFIERGLDESLIAKLEDLINEYKNERSWLESFCIFLTTVCNAPKYGLCTLTGETITLYPKEHLLSWDDETRDTPTWAEKIPENIKLSPSYWNTDNWDVNGWAFG